MREEQTQTRGGDEAEWQECAGRLPQLERESKQYKTLQQPDQHDDPGL